MGERLLEVENLHVQYNAFYALLGVSFHIDRGEMVALLGGNGAGKTTTIKTVSGMLRQSSGSIRFEGQDVSQLPVEQRVAMGIIQKPEGRKLFPEMTIYDNLLVGSYLKPCRALRQQNLERCFTYFPKLYERRNQLAGSLSGGEQEMCAIARALMQNPKLLMLDEPSLGLAPVIVDNVFRVLQDINKEGITILLVEQNVQSSLDICDRAYVIETGHNVLDGNSQDMLHNPEIQRAYIGVI